MATVTLQGEALKTNGDLPEVGSPAPDFRLVDKDLADRSLGDFAGRRKLLSIVPSLDTPVCAESTRKLNELAREDPEAVVLIASADLPFAQQRFCGSEGLENVVTLSMMRDKAFARDYGVLLEDGPLAGLTARAVVAMDGENRITHTQLVPEIGDEPDYDAAVAAVRSA